MPVSVPAPKLSSPSRSARARVPLDLPRGPVGKVLAWYSRRTYGQVMDPGLAAAHHRGVLVAVALFERRVARWRRLAPDLKALAVMATSVRIECSWCLDFGWFEFVSHGLDGDLLAEVPRWRTSSTFTPLQRQVMEYAEAMTATPPTVTDELASSLRMALGVPAFVELTKMISVENERSRFNAALGLASQGFAETCRVPKSKR